MLHVRRGCSFQQVNQCRPLIPVQSFAAINDHVAIQCGHRYEANVQYAQTGRKGHVVGFDPVIDVLRIVDQIHLVDGHDNMRDVDQMGEVGVTSCLCQHAFARVDQDDGKIGGRGGGDHIAGVLFVPRRVGNDVLARAGSEVTIGDVDGDALFALGLKSVGQQREVNGFHASFFRRALYGVQGVGQNRFGVEQKAADQRALAVVDTAAGQEAQEAVVFNFDGLDVLNGGHQK
ncbi:conserved hypothetical protein [Candidatus Propionivibrio aalborgensis]|uniref:Uncharacterized protein n=1 Tax=Candidatus Propionivibrio aalborgensis TaxID=1860101 RepID=A0A1A8XZU9_9RHOO|nr:conserved hypothetical protein [Candidatus Propionivibrio aalborgensis]